MQLTSRNIVAIEGIAHHELFLPSPQYLQCYSTKFSFIENFPYLCLYDFQVVFCKFVACWNMLLFFWSSIKSVKNRWQTGSRQAFPLEAYILALKVLVCFENNYKEMFLTWPPIKIVQVMMLVFCKLQWILGQSTQVCFTGLYTVSPHCIQI